MDQYWMVMKGKQHSVSFVNKNNMRSYSWERAFAEDAGGCMWPPRSYTCGFCRREFRSAQALGGHMNAHRRDRAMLSKSLNLHHLPSLDPIPTSLSAATSPPPRASAAAHSSWSRRGKDGDDIETDLSILMGCKRPRLNVSSSLSPSLKPCFQAAEMIGFEASSMEDLDLELRLGHDPPQVK